MVPRPASVLNYTPTTSILLVLEDLNIDGQGLQYYKKSRGELKRKSEAGGGRGGNR